MWSKNAMPSISTQTVRNCFKKAGFPITCDADELCLLDDVECEAYVTIDECLETEDQSMEILDILNELNTEQEEDGGDDEVHESPRTTTSHEAVHYLDLLKNYFQNVNDIQSYRQISNLQMNFENNACNNKKQSTIFNFFKRIQIYDDYVC